MTSKQSLPRNNSASSLSIPEGVEVRAFDFNFSGSSVTYTSSTADLLNFNNKSSSFVISRASIDGLSVDIGGTEAGSQYDQLLTNAANVEGTLNVSLTGAYIPAPSETFTIVDSSTDLLGAFENVEDGQRMETTGGEGSFVVNYVGDTVVLSDFATSGPAGVIFYDLENFNGPALSLTEGDYRTLVLNESPIGNDSISSIFIPDGFQVTIFQWNLNTPLATLTESTVDLGQFDNQTSSVRITRTDGIVDGLNVTIGGTVAGTQYDQLITNAGTLDGSLNVVFTDLFIPSAAQTFTIVDSTTNLAGGFDNVESGQRVEATDGEGSFVVTIADGTVELSDFVRNEPTDAVVFYGEENFHGYGWGLTEGSYATTDLQTSPIGNLNNTISSISIPAGFEVTIYQWSLNTPLATYSDSRAELGNFDNQTSGILITRTPSLDFGDAPATLAGAGFPTLLANDGARHNAIGPQLGMTRDSEIDGAPSALADGDGADEDGVLFGGIGVTSTIAAVTLELTGISEANPAKVDAWIDFNGNGVFDSDEKILDSVDVSESMQTINYDVPSDLTAGNAYARVRLSTAGGLSPTGLAADGEVEDYVVNIADPPKVESIVVNGGDDQRSSVDSVQITFDQVVDIDNSGGNPFALVHEDGPEVNVVPLISESGGKTVVSLTFDPSGPAVTSFGSLINGDYQLVIDASRVTRSGVELDGNGDGSIGQDYVMSAADGLFRKYGDYSGDGSVGLSDFAAFRQTFGKSQGETGYLDGLDSDGDDSIGLTDFAAFRGNFGS